MKFNILKRTISVLLCLFTVIGIMSPFTVSARYADDFNGTYDDLNCAEDDCDCLEPENNRFAIVSPSSYDNTHNKIVFTGTYEEVQKYFKTNKQTDGLPVIPPTKLKAEKFMQYTSHNDNDIIATANGRKITAYQVAVNAIMSGASAEYMPVCIAFAKALGNEEYLNSLKLGKLTPMMYVNGPIARQLGIDNTQGMTTEECNIAIARFMELALINLTGVKRTNAFGNVQPLVFSENEEICLNIGWQPHHVEQGYALNDSAVTASSFSMWGNNVTPATDLPEEIMKVIAWDITEKNMGALGSSSTAENVDVKRLIFITESVATALATKYKSKDSLENALIETARRPLWMRTYAYYYANTDGALKKSFDEVYGELKANPLEDSKATASPSWMNGITYAEIDTVATMKKGNTDIIITGDSSRNKTQVMPGGSSVTQKIEIPDDWDSLMTSMSYQPLDSFYISQRDTSVRVPERAGIPSVLLTGEQTTYRIVASTNYVTGSGRIYYNSSASSLHYWDKTAETSIVLDNEKYADFIAFVNALGINSSFTVLSDGKINAVNILFSSNKSLPDKNMVELTGNSFGSLVPSIVANVKRGTNGNPSLDGAVITMNDTVTTFLAELGGDIVMGDCTDSDFVKLKGNVVAVNPASLAGSTAVIGAPTGDGTYRTMTIINGGDGTYKIIYNTASTLALSKSSYYLEGTLTGGKRVAFSKTDNTDIVAIKRKIPAGTYTFNIYDAGEDKRYGNTSEIIDVVNRLKMDSDSDISFKATGGEYEFKYEISTGRLSVYPTKKAIESEKISFNDVHFSNHWATEDIDYVVAASLMNGTSQDNFSPDDKLTRAMLVTVLYRNEGEPATNKSISFADVDMEDYYANAVSWAKQNGIVSGVAENEFAPNNNISREQISAIIYRYARYKGYNVSAGTDTDIVSYNDFNSISEYAITPMQYAVGSGLMNGKTASTLNPKDNATRAEIAAILHRFIVANR